MLICAPGSTQHWQCERERQRKNRVWKIALSFSAPPAPFPSRRLDKLSTRAKLSQALERVRQGSPWVTASSADSVDGSTNAFSVVGASAELSPEKSDYEHMCSRP
jgi:hypothetical protein